MPRHSISTVTLPPEHWRWRFIAARHEVSAIVERSRMERPDAIVLSDPVSVPTPLQMLPASWGKPPVAVYLHESQWAYPTARHDTRPYVTDHLDAPSVADRGWFNSSHHRETFRHAALEHMSPRTRKLARGVLTNHRDHTRVVYPSVHIDTTPLLSERTTPRILWAARWEHEKRPDWFATAGEHLTPASTSRS